VPKGPKQRGVSSSDKETRRAEIHIGKAQPSPAQRIGEETQMGGRRTLTPELSRTFKTVLSTKVKKGGREKGGNRGN